MALERGDFKDEGSVDLDFRSARTAKDAIAVYKKKNLKPTPQDIAWVASNPGYQPDFTPALEFMLAQPGAEKHATRGLIACVGGGYDSDREYSSERKARQAKMVKALLDKGAKPNVIFKDETMLMHLEYDVFARGPIEEAMKRRGHYSHPVADSGYNKVKKEVIAELFATHSEVERCRLTPLDKTVMNKCWPAAKLIQQAGGKLTDNGLRQIFHDSDDAIYSQNFEEFSKNHLHHMGKDVVSFLTEAGVNSDGQLASIYLRRKFPEKKDYEGQRTYPPLQFIEEVRQSKVTLSGAQALTALTALPDEQKKSLDNVAGIVSLIDADKCDAASTRDILKFLEKNHWAMKRGVFDEVSMAAKQGPRGHRIPSENNPVNLLGFWLTNAYISEIVKPERPSGRKGASAMSEEQQKAWQQFLHASGYEWKDKFAELRPFQMSDARDAMDYAHEFFRYVILPAALSRMPKKLDEIQPDVADLITGGLEKRLMPQTLAALTKNKGIVEFLEGSERWHTRRTNFLIARDNGTGVMRGIRDYAFEGTWHRLVPEKRIDVPESVSPNHLYILNLESSQELSKEAGALNHCVDGYDTDCRKGKCHIFSIRSETNPEINTTVDIRVQGGKLHVEQHQGYERRNPSKEEQKALDWFLERVKKKAIEVNWAEHGVIQKKGDLPKLLAHVGYHPAEDRLERAFDVFKQPEFRPVQRTGDGQVMVDEKATKARGVEVLKQRRHATMLPADYRSLGCREFLARTGLSQAIDGALREMGFELKPQPFAAKITSGEHYNGLGLS